MAPEEIRNDKLIVTEGKDDALVCAAVMTLLDVNGIYARGLGGKHDFRRKVAALVRTPGFENVISLGVVHDADESAEGAFQAARNALLLNDLPAPDEPEVPVPGPPRVEVVILPGKGANGTLEDICLASVTPSPHIDCVDAYFLCLQENGLQPANAGKARAQAYLAQRDPAYMSPGLAAVSGAWRLDHDAFAPLRNLIVAM
jgi:hypothetical protein